ncbi:MAG: Crp/Fnr family transcriptional regulator [Candidatus Zixiibacteriota bacterium]
MDIDNALRRCSLCAHLNESELAAIAEISSTRSVVRNGMLFLEGDPADGFFSLVEGKVRIYKASPEGREYTIHIISAGQLFAEAAIFQGSSYPANCIALEDSVVIYFPKSEFVDLLARMPEISLKIIGSLSAFLREYNQMVENLSLKEVPARLASYLLGEYDRTPGEVVVLRMSKTALSTKLGTASETLSRNLRKFSDLGIIQVDNKEITILDPARLAAIADGQKI